MEWLDSETGENLGITGISLAQIVIVPALSVDESGMRIGQGGGSYDRALVKSKAWTIALLHRGELTSEPLPVEPHDQKVKAAATPEIIVRF